MIKLKRPNTSKDKKELIHTIYEQSTDWFDEHRGKNLIEKEYLDFVVKTIPKGGTILDLGCGTGEPIAQFFIERGYVLTGIDASSNMIGVCQKRFPQSRFTVADMCNVNLKETFDAVIAWDSFFHLDHESQRAMFPIFESHLNPGGVLIFTSGTSHGEAFGEINGYELYHASLASEEYQKLLEEHHFEVKVHRVEDPQCGNHTVWVAQKKGRELILLGGYLT